MTGAVTAFSPAFRSVWGGGVHLGVALIVNTADLVSKCGFCIWGLRVVFRVGVTHVLVFCS